MHQQNEHRSCGTYAVRCLTKADLPRILELCQGNPQYYYHLHEHPTVVSINEDMERLPPGCTAGQKSYLGFFDSCSKLIAVLDLVRGYPTTHHAFIGFFMVCASEQGCGVGRRIIRCILNHLRNEGFDRVRLAYVEGNEQSSTFWLSCGFSNTGERVVHDRYALIPMERRL